MSFGRLGTIGRGFGGLGTVLGSAGIPRNALFGVNVNGAEFAPNVGQSWPTSQHASYLASKGVGFVRLPIAWESLQPTLSAALNTTYLNNLKAAIATLKAAGISTIVDLHNFGHYAQPAVWSSTVTYAGNAGTTITNVNTLGDATLTSSVFADVWTRLSTALAGTSGLIGYGIMNEPVNIIGKNLIKGPNYFSGSFTTWGKGGTETLTIKSLGTNPLGSNYSPAWTLSTTNYGNTSQVLTTTAGQHTFSAYIRNTGSLQNAYLQIDGTQVGISDTSSWVRYSQTATLTAASHTFSIGVNGPSFGGSGSIEIANAQIETGASATTYEPNPYLTFAQAAINAIRAVDTSTPIYVNGLQNGGTAVWQGFNFELATLTGTDLIMEAHQYFDGPQGIGGGGTYSGSYASYSIDAQTGVQALAPFTAWLTATSRTGFLGEFGIPGSNSSWQTVQTNFLNAAKAASLEGAQWYYNGNKTPADLNIATADDARLIQMLAIK